MAQPNLSTLLRRREHRTAQVQLLWPPSVKVCAQALVDEMGTSLNELVLTSLHHTLYVLANEAEAAEKDGPLAARIKKLISELDELRESDFNAGNRGNRLVGSARRERSASDATADSPSPDDNSRKESHAA